MILQVRLAPVALLGGLACGVATVAVYQWWWGLALGVAVCVLTAFATPPGWGTRLPFAVGDAVAVAALAVPRAEGDYLVLADRSGYVVVGLTLVLVVFCIATLPRPGRLPSRPSDPTPEPTSDPTSDRPAPGGDPQPSTPRAAEET